VVASKGLAKACKKFGVLFLDENTVVDGVHNELIDHQRWGWYFQQILKLGIAWREDNSHYLVVDADTVFLRPLRFMSSHGRSFYDVSNEYHPPYFETFERLLGFAPIREHSFITHHMVFRCDKVRQMCSAFRPDPVWWKNIVDCLAPGLQNKSRSQFSEYETYGHWMQVVSPEDMAKRDLRWRNVADHPSARRIARYAREYDFVSFQEYLREERRLSQPWRVYLSGLKRKILDA
jgi:hypothetical protein